MAVGSRSSSGLSTEEDSELDSLCIVKSFVLFLHLPFKTRATSVRRTPPTSISASKFYSACMRATHKQQFRDNKHTSPN